MGGRGELQPKGGSISESKPRGDIRFHTTLHYDLPIILIWLVTIVSFISLVGWDNVPQALGQILEIPLDVAGLILRHGMMPTP